MAFSEQTTEVDHSIDESYNRADEVHDISKASDQMESVEKEDRSALVQSTLATKVKKDRMNTILETSSQQEALENNYSKNSSQIMSVINSPKESSSTISKSSSSQGSPRLGFSIAQIMGFMSRGVNLKTYEESENKTTENEANFKGNKNNGLECGFNGEEMDFKRRRCTDDKDKVQVDQIQQSSPIKSAKYSKYDSKLWRPQPCRKYINAAAVHAAAAVSKLAAQDQMHISLEGGSAHVPPLSPTLSPTSVVPPSEPISPVQQPLNFPIGNDNNPLQQPDLNTIALLRQYSLMNFSNPWKTASLLSSYSNLLGLHNQLNFQQQKHFSGEGVHTLPQIMGGIPYLVNNHTTPAVSNVASNFENRSLPPPLSFIGGMAPNTVADFNLRTSSDRIQCNNNHPFPMSGSTDSNRAAIDAIYPQRYPSLKLSENNVKGHTSKCKTSIPDGARTTSFNSDIKAQTKGKETSSLNSPSTGSKGSMNQAKSFPCSECGKIFNAHYNLTRHMPVHTGKL